MAVDYEARRSELKRQRDREFNEFLKSQNDFTFNDDLAQYHETKRHNRELGISSLNLGKVKPRKPQEDREYRPRLSENFELSPRRMSSRIRKRTRTFTEETSDDDEKLVELDENWRYSAAPAIRTSTGPRFSEYKAPPSVKLVTEQMLDNVFVPGKRKKYSQSGTSCHQCRQKTDDQKTICRSGECIGGRGMLCQPCLHNRYGEDINKVLLDENWRCPCCSGFCNQSNCLRKAGFYPTGSLYPYIGGKYKSVKDYLIGENLYPLPKNLAIEENPNDGDNNKENKDANGKVENENNNDTASKEVATLSADCSDKVDDVKPNCDMGAKQDSGICLETANEIVYTDDEEDFLGW